MDRRGTPSSRRVGIEQPGRSRDRAGVTRRGGMSRRIAWLLDDAFRVPGTRVRFGLDPFLGLVPGGGDAVGGVLSGWIILSAARQGAPPAVLFRMAGNVAVDVILGVVPLVGDLFDAGWKSNRRNMALLEHYLTEPEPITRSSRVVLVAVLAGLVLLFVAAAAVTIAVIRAVAGLF